VGQLRIADRVSLIVPVTPASHAPESLAGQGQEIAASEQAGKFSFS
jgi:hypothetical protein